MREGPQNAGDNRKAVNKEIGLTKKGFGTCESLVIVKSKEKETGIRILMILQNLHGEGTRSGSLGEHLPDQSRISSTLVRDVHFPQVLSTYQKVSVQTTALMV